MVPNQVAGRRHAWRELARGSPRRVRTRVVSSIPLLILYSLLIVAASMLGGHLPSLIKMTHRRTQFVLSFVGGFMLGVALLHLLPHGVLQAGSLDLVMSAALAGLLFMFFLIRAFHFHDHGAAAEGTEHGCAEDHHHRHHHEHGAVNDLSWTGVALGLSIHTLIDGVALGAAVRSDEWQGVNSWYGFAVFLAIVLHKPLDALSITSLMTAANWPPQTRQVVNAGFSMMCPLGALLVVLGMHRMDAHQAQALGMILGFSAGVFLCISLSDLLPEVQFHRHDRFQLSAALLLGILAAYGVGVMEGDHAHDLPVRDFVAGRPGRTYRVER